MRAAILLLLVASPALAASPLRVDVEVDPIAYALDGYSLHVGLGAGAWRVDLGAFAATLPEVAHGQTGFDASFSGFGMKLDRTFGEDGMGLALGLEAGLSHLLVRRDDRAAVMRLGTVTARVGYRLPLGEHFFVMPWVGVGAYLGARDVAVGDATWAQPVALVFPTVHVGYRLP